MYTTKIQHRIIIIIELHPITWSKCGRIWEKKHFTQNTIFFAFFRNRQHSKASRGLGFWLGLIAVGAFYMYMYFIDPTLEATASVLSWAVSCQREASINGDFQIQSMHALAMPDVGGAHNS